MPEVALGETLGQWALGANQVSFAFADIHGSGGIPPRGMGSWTELGIANCLASILAFQQGMSNGLRVVIRLEMALRDIGHVIGTLDEHVIPRGVSWRSRAGHLLVPFV